MKNMDENVMEEAQKELLLASAAMERDDYQNAGNHFAKLLEYKPEDPAALFYVGFCRLHACEPHEVISEFKSMCNNTKEAFLSLAKADMTDEEKEKLGQEMFVKFLPMTKVISGYVFKLYQEKILSYEEIESVYTIDWIGLRCMVDLGSTLMLEFQQKPLFVACAIKAWKEAIDIRHSISEYKNYQDRKTKLWFEKCEEAIKKFEPDYEMPKFKQQGGCVVGGDGANVPKGE